ncbi:MAG: hypothetical protein ACQEP7_02540 [bacterium]
MPFSPLDLQVAIQQAGRVADEVASEKEAPDKAREEKAREEIEQRQLEENTADEAGETDDNNKVGEEPEGSAQGYQSYAGEEEEEEEEETTSASGPESSEVGSYLDLTT